MRQAFVITRRDGIDLVGPPPSSLGLEAWTTTRRGGESRGPWASLNLEREGRDEAAAVRANSRKLLAALGLPGIAFPRQVHGAEVLEAGYAPRGFSFRRDGDAIVTTRRGTAVGVLTADCLPVLLWEREGTALAAVHAGWRGVAAGVVPAAVAVLRQRFGVRASRLEAWLGPAIGPCCYQVDGEVAAGVERSSGPGAVRHEGDHFRVDLAVAARIQLLAAGLPPDAVSQAPFCTHCHPELFYSFRRDGVETGRMATVVFRI